MKPIEPGCLVLVLDGVAVGESGAVDSWFLSGSVIEAKGERARYVGPDGWLVCFSDGARGVFQPRYLMRIDDHDEKADETEKEMEVVYG